MAASLPLPDSGSSWGFTAKRTPEPHVEYARVRPTEHESLDLFLRCTACGAEAGPGERLFSELAVYPNGRWIRTARGYWHACIGYSQPPAKARKISASIWR